MGSIDYFCPRCGVKTEYRREYNGLCEKCYLELFGEKISRNYKGGVINVTQCKICGRIKFGNKWLKSNERSLKKLVVSGLKRGLKRPKDTEVVLNIQTDQIKVSIPQNLSVEIYDKKTKNKIGGFSIRIRVEKAVCELCQLKQAGEYYEYVVRLRTSNSTFDFEKEILPLLNEFNFPVEDHVKINRLRNGIDLYFTNRKLGEDFAKKLAGHRGISIKKIVQRKYFKSLEKNVIIENAILTI